MSMPNFPEDVLDVTCEQALNMLLGSIAMEELALSHIMNAEGEKLQYILGTLPGSAHVCTTPKEVLEVNRSVSDLLEKVAYNQILLKGKLQQVVEAKALFCPPEPPEPPEPPCPPRPEHPCCVLSSERGCCWSAACPLPWRRISKCDRHLCWQGRNDATIHLCPQNALLLSFSFRVCAPQTGVARVVLRALRGCSYEELSACEAFVPERGASVCLSGSAVLSPECGETFPSQIQFVLQSPDCVILERAVCRLTAL